MIMVIFFKPTVYLNVYVIISFTNSACYVIVRNVWLLHSQKYFVLFQAIIVVLYLFFNIFPGILWLHNCGLYNTPGQMTLMHCINLELYKKKYLIYNSSNRFMLAIKMQRRKACRLENDRFSHSIMVHHQLDREQKKLEEADWFFIADKVV